QRRFKADLAAQENNLEMDIKDLNDSRVVQQSNAQVAAANTDNETDNVNRITYDEFGVLVRRIDRMESSIGSIVSKIENVLTKLELLEKGKMKRREALTRILNNVSEDDKLSKEMKHERLEKMIRDELEETNPARQTSNQSVIQRTKPSSTHGSGHSQ
ncbi:unnamed protein product, partial [Rotaria sordida]